MGECKKYMAEKLNMEKASSDEVRVPIFICNDSWKRERMEKWYTTIP